MKIQFEIKETLAEIVEEILHSKKWQAVVRNETHGLRRVVIKDLKYDSEASIDIWQHEIHIITAWSNFSYRIYERGNEVCCEYIGAYRGLLEQNLLPKITPKRNILESKVLNSSLFGKEGQIRTLRNYSEQILQLKKSHVEDFNSDYQMMSIKEHPQVVHDEFINEGALIPSMNKDDSTSSNDQ